LPVRGLDKCDIISLRYIKRGFEMEKTMRVSPGIYELVKKLADTGDASLHEVTDNLLTAGLKQLEILGPLSDLAEDDKTIQVREVNGAVYYCTECQHPLDPKEKLGECPSCGVELDWGETKKGLGIIGWGLVGLATLLVWGATTSSTQSDVY